MEVIKKIKSHEIIDTGCVIIPHGEYLEFQISNLKFRVVFEEEKTDPTESNIQIGVKGSAENSYMEILLYNQSQSYFSGLNEMIELATIDNRKLWFMFRVQSISNGSKSEHKIFYYTWFHEDALDNTSNNSKAVEE